MEINKNLSKKRFFSLDEVKRSYILLTYGEKTIRINVSIKIYLFRFIISDLLADIK